jgi:hypothetical protein
VRGSVERAQLAMLDGLVVFWKMGRAFEPLLGFIAKESHIPA